MKNSWVDIDDFALFSLLKQGDEQAFEVIYRRHWKVLFDAAYRRLPVKEKCQDIIQNIFVDLWHRRDTLEIEKPMAYLHGAVRFQVLKSLSKEHLNASFYTSFENDIVSPLNADEAVLTKEAKYLLQLFLATLSKKRRKIFTMYHFEGLKSSDIAVALNISEKTVRNQLSEAGRLLKLRITQLFLLFLVLIFLF
ncbi:sigma-70 family RNA polymerase sigma factor [Pedobacter sp.]|uniref:RNA polymerase sigma factor n=1 Tax=Pedobacter sp. TaxID=1411316 RepID=UPI0031E2A242